MTGRVGLRQRARYHLDNLLSRGTWAVLVWLGAITLLIVLVSSALLAIFGVTFAGSEGESWLEDFWQSLLRTIDAGTMAADVGWGRRLLALLVTILGLLIAGTLIGIIAAGVEQRVEQMQRGRSTVVESGHVVILGGTRRLPVIVEQLALARRGRGNTIVVLADHEPREMADDVRAVAGDLHGTKLVFRRGDPARTSDLDMVALPDARSVIVLSDEDRLGDAGVVKAALAAGAILGGFDRVPIIAEFGDPEMGESLVRASGGAVHTIAAMRSIAASPRSRCASPGSTGSSRRSWTSRAPASTSATSATWPVGRSGRP